MADYVRQGAPVYAPAGSGPTTFDLDFSLATIVSIGSLAFSPNVMPYVELVGYPHAQTAIGAALSAPFGGEAAVLSIVRLEEGAVLGPPGTIQTGERRHGRVTRPAPRGTRR